MQYGQPKCYSCKFFKSNPKKIGGSGSCTKYKSIPKNIFFKAGNCQKFKSK